MASLYEVMEGMETLLESNGYTVFRLSEFYDKKVNRLSGSKYPVIFLYRQLETIDNDGSPLGFLSNQAVVDVNVVLNTGEDNLDKDSAIELRKIKNIIYSNQCNDNLWTHWQVTDNHIAQLQSTNEKSKIFGGVNINTLVKYRELQVE